MKLVNNLDLLDLNLDNTEEQVSVKTDLATSLDHLIYRELDDRPVQGIDEIQRLSENIKTLSELNSRLSFTMREVEYLLNIKNI